MPKEGDANSRFFHACINARRRSNQIWALLDGEIWTEGISEIREAIKNHFSNQFSDVWSCGDDKSLGPDGFNFRFIKSSWSSISCEVCGMVAEFYNKAKLPAGLVSSFI